MGTPESASRPAGQGPHPACRNAFFHHSPGHLTYEVSVGAGIFRRGVQEIVGHPDRKNPGGCG